MRPVQLAHMWGAYARRFSTEFSTKDQFSAARTTQSSQASGHVIVNSCELSSHTAHTSLSSRGSG